MKKIDYFILAGFLLMIFYNLFLNYKISIIKNDIKFSKDTINEYHQIIRNNANFTGSKLNIERTKHLSNNNIVFRFTDSCCFDCVQEGLVLLEKVFKKDTLKKNLLIVTSPNFINHFKEYDKIVKPDELLEVDRLKIPYVCFVDPSGFVIFTLLLKPKNYDINKKILTVLNNHLHSKPEL